MVDKEPHEGVRVVDIDMPFGSMVKFMVKWSIAAIPALIILLVIGFAVGGLVAGATKGMVSSLAHSTTPKPLPAIDSVAAQPPPVPAEPQWELTQSTNPLDDSPIVLLSLDASSPAETMLGGAPSLILRCKSKQTEAFINWNTFLGSEETSVTMRLGHDAAVRRSWGLSSDSRATFYPGDVPAFIKRAMNVDTLVAMTTPYNASPVTAVFTTAGLAAKIEPLRKACAW